MIFSQFLKLVAAAAVTIFLLSSCASTASKNANDVLSYDSDSDYRSTESQLSDTIDMPPNLLAPANGNDQFGNVLSKTKPVDPEASYQYVPSYKAQNVKLDSDLSERWLDISGMDSEKVWKGVQAFLVSMGFKIQEARKDTGFIRTQFTPRKELVPLDAQGPLTRMLNSWRPELAEGVYDRLTARVVYDPETKVTRVYFYHYMIFDANQINTDDQTVMPNQTGWKIKHYNPMIEAEALYQAMIFFGTSQESALKQVEVTIKQAELVDNKTEFEGLLLKASKEVSWSYLVAMVYRANWKLDHMNQKSYELWVQIPKGTLQDKNTSSWAFWKDKKVSPSMVVRFTLEDAPEDGKTAADKSKVQPVVGAVSLLKVHALASATPFTAEQKQSIFKSLGLLAQ